jgi:AcrR family transcriptional regulator
MRAMTASRNKPGQHAGSVTPRAGASPVGEKMRGAGQGGLRAKQSAGEQGGAGRGFLADGARPLRRDAQRNRDAILTAARAAFAAQGVEAPLETVARHAGVAIGTLYRHFPSRPRLVEAVFIAKARAWVDAAEQALGMPDAWEGFAYYLERLCELQADDRGFNDVACMHMVSACCLEEAKDRALALGRQIVVRAQQAGALRADVTAEDIAFLLWGSTRITEATYAVAPRAWRRHLALMLDAFRAGNAHALPEPPLQPQQVHEAMMTLADPGRGDRRLRSMPGLCPRSERGA